MLKLSTVLLLLSWATILWADWFAFSRDGTLRMPNGTEMVLLHAAPGWKHTEVASGNLTRTESAPDTVTGEFRVVGGAFQLHQTLAQDEFTADFSVKLSAAEPVETEYLCLRISVPVEVFLESGATVDGRQLTFPAEYSDAQRQTRSRFRREMILPVPGGKLHIAGPAQYLLMDGRRYNRPLITLRLPLTPHEGALGEAEIRCKLTFVPNPGEKPRRPAGLDKPVVIEAGTDDYFPIDYRYAAEGSALDLSFLQDAPAGQYGFLRTTGPHFEFEGLPGKRIRFYGSNLCQTAAVPPGERAAEIAQDIARRGYNLVRFHHFDRILTDVSDASGATRLREEEIAKMDLLAHELRQRGIYYTLDLFTARAIPSRILTDFPEQRALTGHEVKSLFFLRPEVYNNIREFSLQLLNHVNPHTGLAWKDDPALVAIGLINENTLSTMPARFAPHSYTAQMFAEKFRAYAAEQNWQEAQAEQEYQLFLAHLYREGIGRLIADLRQAGVRQPLSDQNFHNNHAVHLHRQEYDFVDNHAYWGHPVWIGPQRNRLPARIEPAGSIVVGGSLGQFGRIATSRNFDRPMAVTEWNFVNPNRFLAEGSLFASALASLQGWDMMVNFAYSHTAEAKPRPATFFDTATDPVRRLGEQLGALLFLRGDVAESDLAFAYALPANYLAGKGRGNTEPSTQLPLLAMIGKLGCVTGDATGDFRFPAGTRAVINAAGFTRDHAPMATVGEEEEIMVRLANEKLLPAHSYLPAERIIRSSTGELSFFRADGRFRLVTPRTEGFVLPEGAAVEGNAIRHAVAERAFQTLAVTSRDDLELSASGHMLIFHLADQKNSGQVFRNADMNILERWGTTPVLARRSVGRLEFKRSLQGFRLYALDLAGKRVKEIPISGNAITCDNWCDGQYVAVYELIRET